MLKSVKGRKKDLKFYSVVLENMLQKTDIRMGLNFFKG